MSGSGAKRVTYRHKQRSPDMKNRNHVARNAWKFNKSKVYVDRKKEQARRACRKKGDQ